MEFGVWRVGIVESATESKGARNDAKSPFLYELAEFDFAEWVKVVPLGHFHFGQRRAVSEIGRKEFGKNLAIKAHLEPEGVERGNWKD